MMKNYFNLIGDDLLSKILDIVVSASGCCSREIHSQN